MGARFVVRLMFEWGGGCLSAGNDAAFDAFDLGPIEDRLPLSPATRQRLGEGSAWHDGSLDWVYPPDPSPWPPAERERFANAAAKLLADVRAELGAELEV